MTAPTPTTATVNVHDHVKDLTAQIARCDSKASLLLALIGTSLAGILAAASNTRPPAPAVVVGVLGAGLLLTATLLLLAVVRPNLNGPGWPRWPEMTDNELHSALTAEARLDEARSLARLARRKFRFVQAAVDCTRAGIGVLTVAGVLAAVL